MHVWLVFGVFLERNFFTFYSPVKQRKSGEDLSKPVDKHLFQVPVMPRLAQVDLIAELKRRQVSPLMREGKDGTIEDIITGQRSKDTRA